MPVTLVEIAQAAGVSVSTVSRVLNNTDHAISEQTRIRIRQLAASLGYKPNLLARGLQAQHSLIAGIIVDNIASEFAPPIVRSIQDRLMASGYSITIINSDYYPEVELDAIRTLLSFPVDGIIFVDTWLHKQSTELPLTDKPYVFVNRINSGSDTNFIEPDDYAGAQLAVNHLLRLGHQRIAYINGPTNWKASRERLAGYRDALQAAGVAFDPGLVQVGDWRLGTGYAAAKELLALPERPTAIFAGNDLMAVGVIYAAEDTSLRVPQDVALVGYDNRSEATVVRPTLTTVTMPLNEMGRAAADIFLSRVKGEPVPAGAEKLKGHLIVRQSCGSPVQSEPDPEPSTWNRFDRISQMTGEESYSMSQDETSLAGND